MTWIQFTEQMNTTGPTKTDETLTQADHIVKCASTNLLIPVDENIDVALIQGPWIASYWSIISQHNRRWSTENKNMYCQGEFAQFAVPRSEFQRPIRGQTGTPGSGYRYISSSYMAHDQSAPSEELQHFTSIISAKNQPVDQLWYQCKHTLWGSSEIDERCESFVYFIISPNLSVCSRDNKPTFHLSSLENCFD